MKKVLIIGAGVAGKDVADEIKNNPSIGLEVVGFVDDDLNKKGKSILGYQVLGKGENLSDLIRKHGINEVIIAIPSAEGEAIRNYVKICSQAKISFRLVPRVREIIEGKASFENLRKVRIEDLLGRPVIKSDIEEIKEFVKGRVVLVTGAAGSIGSELARQLASYQPKELVLLDWWENGIFDLKTEFNRDFPNVNVKYFIANIQDKIKIDSIFDSLRPEYVFHAAAYKHVPLMEDFPDEAVKNNVFGTLNVATSALKYKTSKFILISTDKAANPINVMGATKLVTEGIGQMLNGKSTKYITVRFGNDLGSFGSVVPLFQKQIEKGGPLTITDKKMVRYFMTIEEAVQLILKAGAKGKGGELFVLDMGRPVKIMDLAENMIRLMGYIPNEEIKIKIVGKRSGEKIKEILFNQKEKTNLIKTEDNKIFLTKSAGLDMDKLPRVLDELTEVINNGKIDKVRSVLSKLVISLKQ